MGSRVTDPDITNTPYIYLTAPWIYLVMFFVVGVIILNCTMCLCITCRRRPKPITDAKGKVLYDNSSDDECLEINVYGQK